MKINGLDLYTGVSEWDKGSMALGKDAQIAAYTGATSFNATAIGTRAIAMVIMLLPLALTALPILKTISRKAMP